MHPPCLQFPPNWPLAVSSTTLLCPPPAFLMSPVKAPPALQGFIQMPLPLGNLALLFPVSKLRASWGGGRSARVDLNQTQRTPLSLPHALYFSLLSGSVPQRWPQDSSTSARPCTVASISVVTALLTSPWPPWARRLCSGRGRPCLLGPQAPASPTCPA